MTNYNLTQTQQAHRLANFKSKLAHTLYTVPACTTANSELVGLEFFIASSASRTFLLNLADVLAREIKVQGRYLLHLQTKLPLASALIDSDYITKRHDLDRLWLTLELLETRYLLEYVS